MALRFASAERLRRLFWAQHGERLAARARELGLVTEAQLEEARADGRPLPAVLVERGWLDEATLAKLSETEAREEFSRPSTIRLAAVPPEVEEAAALPERNLDEFVLVTPLGRGGAGEVWRAWARRLGRWVAVKISIASLDSASAHQRFEREALATARLAHPNIVPIFQVGTVRGRSFLVMPHVDGQTLDRASLPLRQALEVMHTVALAVEHAHQQGIVHRDLKPGNIIVSPRAGGVFVLDFGLAFLREETSSRLTRPGELLGTASYMAPEQARGEHTAPGTAVDVYGLGATLYALISGRAPFVGDSFPAVVARVMTADPEPLRRLCPGLDPRIEAVVQRAMDKDPRRRHATAAALSDDLQRLLDDRQPTARLAGPLQRLRRRMRGHLILSAAAALAGAALLVTAVARFRLDRERHAAVDTLRDMARLSLDTALRLRRAGDTVGMRQVLPQLVAAYQRVEERGAASAEVDYLMGRMYRALLDEERAMAHQERALTRDPAFADALYERAVLLSRRYGRELTQTFSELHAVDADTAERARPALGRLRTRIVEDWTRLEALAPSKARTLAARGILALHRGRLDEARDLLSRAVAADPQIEEAWETLARTHAVAHRTEDAEETYTRALALDRGYAPHLVGRCQVRRLLGRESDAVTDADRALAIDPASTGARLCRAETLLKLAHHQIMSGADAREALDGAERDFTEVMRHEDSSFALVSRGIARRYRGIFLERHGTDPLPQYAAAEADFTRGTLGPRPSEHWANRGRLRTRRALHLIEGGQDGSAELDAAQADLEHALSVDPTASLAVEQWMGDVQAYRGLQALRRGQPADAHFAAAEASYTRGDIPANDGWIHLDRGTMRTWRGIARARAGGDPLPLWAAAEKDLDHAAQVFPGDTDPLVRRGLLRLERARQLGDRRERERGLADLRRALTQEPDHREALDALR